MPARDRLPAGSLGSVGGALRCNAGDRYGDIGQFVRQVEVMDSGGTTQIRERDELRFGERASLLWGLIFGVTGFFGFALATRGWMLMSVIPFIALWGISAPTIQSLMSRDVDQSW